MSTLATATGRALEDIVRRADQHTMAVQRWLASRAPGAVVQPGPVTLASTGYQVSLLNLALGCQMAEADSCEPEIMRVRAFFQRRGVPWLWWVGPTARPAALPAHLAQHTANKSELPAMVAPLPGMRVPLDSHIRVRRAETIDDLKAASHIRHTAFRFPPGAALDYFEAMAESWLAHDPAQLFLASVEGGPPAAIGAMILGDGLPGVYVMATLPAWGRRGLGKAILTALLDAAAQHSAARMVVLTASRFGYPLYQQFGFEEVFKYNIFAFEN